jgi:CDP-diacylglycerol--serine O-phosphatidyltransferase
MLRGAVRRVSALPNLLTLGNAWCGLLAIAKAIDAMVLSRSDASLFYPTFQTACLLIFLGMLFDALDGKVARLVGGSSEFGAQLDSFSDALTFGCAPALLAKVLIEHEAREGVYSGNARLHFIAAAAFALMAILRLARFNLETTTDESSHRDFKGLPSPAAAGALVSTLLLYLELVNPPPASRIGDVGWFSALIPHYTPSQLGWMLPTIASMMPLLGVLMVSRVRYTHAVSFLTRKGSFFLLVYLVFASFLLYAAPEPVLFVAFVGFALLGVIRTLFPRKPDPNATVPVEDEIFVHGARD